MTTTAATLRRELADALAESGKLTALAWRAAIEHTPRELFLGSSFYRGRGVQWEPVHRDQVGVDEWLRLVYSDTTWVTQVDGIDAADTDRPLSGNPTSSSTLPSLVAWMLELSGIGDGDKVLEIGTGTGYSTAILCHRLGDTNVFSVEYDPGLVLQRSMP
ncbi:hypothetical protein [Streptomyces sp. NPDC005283]|uniref:hypothetical protein n=1 Tax=Streptomyces sp. NPDC005283 TaxID=3156871 RepID=UPI0034534588